MLNFLGDGGAFSCSTNSCAYRIDNKSLLLIDCGENTFSKIKNILDSNDIDNINIIVTHTHSDHVNGLSTLIFYCYYIKKIHVHIYTGSKNVSKDISSLLKINGNIIDVQFKIYHIETDLLKLNDVLISFYKTKHVDELECFGILINADGYNAYYSGDSLTIPKTIYELMKENVINVLFQDIGCHYEGRVHMSIEDLKSYDFSMYKGKIFTYHNDNGLLQFK